jgi:hypothetical protein
VAFFGSCSSVVTTRQRRFLAERLDGLVDEPRPGRPPTISVDQVEVGYFRPRTRQHDPVPAEPRPGPMSPDASTAPSQPARHQTAATAPASDPDEELTHQQQKSHTN